MKGVHWSQTPFRRSEVCLLMLQARNTHESARRLVIEPRHQDASTPHCCPICPANLCKARCLALAPASSFQPLRLHTCCLTCEVHCLIFHAQRSLPSPPAESLGNR